jgi:hypothetical protein
MAYIYMVDFKIESDQMKELEIGSSLERVLSYLKALLPSMPGFITARSMYSLQSGDKTRIIFQSAWQTWSDLEEHRNSALVEDKILKEFEPHVETGDLRVQVLEEIA